MMRQIKKEPPTYPLMTLSSQFWNDVSQLRSL